MLPYDELVHLRGQHPACRLLRADYAALVLSFLGRVFVDGNGGALLADELGARPDYDPGPDWPSCTGTVQPLLKSAVRLAVGFRGHKPDELDELDELDVGGSVGGSGSCGGGEDNPVGGGAGPEHQPFALRIEQAQVA